MCETTVPGACGVLASRIYAALLPMISWEGGHWEPSASIGVAQIHPADDTDTVLRRADAAMYEIKRVRHRSQSATIRTPAPS